VTTSVVNGTVPGAHDVNAEHARRALSAEEKQANAWDEDLLYRNIVSGPYCIHNI